MELLSQRFTTLPRNLKQWQDSTRGTTLTFARLQKTNTYWKKNNTPKETNKQQKKERRRQLCLNNLGKSLNTNYTNSRVSFSYSS